MATKKAVAKPAKAAAKKTTVKKSVKTVGKKKKEVKKGDKYSCDVCGLVVSVDEACGCIDTCDIICCGEQMKAGK